MSERIPFQQITVIGGGTGGSTLAGGLAEALPESNITSIVTTSDSGGSTGALRYSFGTIAVGDARKNIAALCPYPDAADVIERRYGHDHSIHDVEIDSAKLNKYITPDMAASTHEIAKQLDNIKGHTYGNFLLTALARESTLYDGLRELGEALGIRGQVIPITEDPHELRMHDAGEIIIGEHEIDTRHIREPKGALVSLTPEAQLHSAAYEAITQADAVFIAPGSVFTSLGAALSATGVTEAFQAMKGRLVQVANLTSQEHETPGWEVADYINAIAHYTNRYPDYVFYNNAPLPNGESMIPFDRAKLERVAPHTRAIGKALVKDRARVQDPNDPLLRSRLTHHTEPIASYFRHSVRI